MNRSLAPVAALLFSVSILLMGQGLQGTLLPVRATLENFSTITIGMMGAAYFFGFTIGCLKGGQLVRNVGHVRVFLAMTALASAVPLLHGLFVNQWLWSCLRLVTGFCLAAIYIVIESWLNDTATNENRGFIFSTYAMITLTVLAIGQMMLLLYDPTGIQLFAIASVLVSIAAIPVALSTGASPDPPQSVAIDVRRLLRVSPTGTIGVLVTGLVNGSFWALAPVFTQGVSDNVDLAAWFMTAAVIGGALAQWPLGMTSDRVGRRPVLVAMCMGGAAAGIGLVSFVSGASMLLTSTLAAAWGMLAFPLYSICVAYANDHARPGEQVLVSSGLLLMYGIGASVGPFLAAALMTLTGYVGLFLYAACLHIALTIIALARTAKRPAVAVSEAAPFGDSLAAAQTASQVYEEEIMDHGRAPHALPRRRARRSATD